MAAFRNLVVSRIRFAGSTNIAHIRRSLHDRTDVFAGSAIQQTTVKPNRTKPRQGRADPPGRVPFGSGHTHSSVVGALITWVRCRRVIPEASGPAL